MSWADCLLFAPALFLLFGLPALDARSKKKTERRLREERLKWELAFLYVERGREGLEAKLAADLRQVLVNSLVRADAIDVNSIMRALHGEVADDVADVQVVSPKDDFFMYFWPRMRAKRVKR